MCFSMSGRWTCYLQNRVLPSTFVTMHFQDSCGFMLWILLFRPLAGKKSSLHKVIWYQYFSLTTRYFLEPTFIHVELIRSNDDHGLGRGYRVCVWSAIFLVILAGFGACSLINRFTRLSGELFGLLIAALFIQQAVKVSPRPASKIE